MKNEGKFRLKQIDFFGILSTHTTMIEEVDEEVQHRYDIIERDTPAYLDLWLRAQLHGYADDIDPNLVRDSVEREPIPLRSIRVPLINGLSSAWAPNGYGKTYIFSHLEKLKSIQPGLNSSLEEATIPKLTAGWLNALDEIKDDYPNNNSDLVPYHALGLVLEGETGLFAVIWLPKSDRFFWRRVMSDNENGMFSFDTMTGWSYAPGQAWEEQQMDETSIEGGMQEWEDHDDVKMAISLYTDLDVIYHETPSESDKKGFNEFLQHQRLYLETNPPLGLGLSRLDWLRTHGHWNNYRFHSRQFIPQLREIMDSIFLLGAPSSFDSTLLDEEAEMHEFNRILDALASEEDRTSLFPDNLLARDLDFQNVEDCFHFLTRILFAVTDRHQNLGVRFVEALYLALQNNDPDGERHHPLFEYVDSLLVEYALATGRSIPDRPDNHPISDWLHYRTISALQRSVRDSGEEELASILNVGFDVPDWAKQRIQQLPWYGEERESESLSITTLQEWAWRCVSDGFEKSTNIVSEHGTLVPVLSPYWMFLYPNSFDVNDFPASARENFEALCDGLSAHWHTGFATTESFGSPSGQYVEAFFPTLMPLPIVLQFLEEDINRCLNPKTIEANPWAVQADFNEEFELQFSPYGQPLDHVHARHLSFGMRSEVTLQCVLTRFAHENRSRRATNASGFAMLILDEPEIGRSEFWVQLLIERLERLSVQSQGSANSGILLVSHRDKVARESSPTGAYPVMQKVPEGDMKEFEIDED